MSTAAANDPAPISQSLSDWLTQAQDRHADAPADVARELRQRAPALPADDLGAQALRLAEHLWLGHLGDPAGLAACLARVPVADAPTPANAEATARIRWALATLADTPTPTPPLDDAPRWRALQNVVLALAQQGQAARAQALLLADEAAAAAHGAQEAGRAYAAAANNVAAHLCDGMPAATAGAADRQRLMLAAADLSLRAWAIAGTWLHRERAHYRLALCHAALGQGGPALAHAQHCLHACQVGDGSQPADALEHFFAHEALARAHHAAADTASRQAAIAHRQEMQNLLPAIDEADGQRAWCAQALHALPTLPKA